MTSPNGKTAETELKVLTRLSDVTLVELRPKTGRTHQLRVHLQKLGHPILGDRLYGEETSANRLMLHAKLLSLRLPNGQSQTFEAPLPPDFKDELNRYEQA
jgi:23S rRNA-/tRNA-specific pseudouridylate synthase